MENSEDTVRDVMKDRLRAMVIEFISKGNDNIDDINEFVCKLADEAFSVCGIPEKEQDEAW